MALSPYEAHLYRRIARELPVRVVTLAAQNDGRDWTLEGTDEIGLVDLSGGDSLDSMFSVGAQRREWRRGGKAIELLKESGVSALMLIGYNNLGRLRLAKWCRRHGAPVILRTDSNLADEHGKSGLKLAIKRAFIATTQRLFDIVTAIGPRGIDYWTSYGLPPERLVIVPYEPDYSLLESITDEEVDEARRRYGLDPARRRIVFSGRLVSVKRVDLLIDAFAAIAEERPEWDLLIVGDGELRAELEARVPEPLRGRVLWPGFVSEQRDVNRLYRASDVLALPSEREPWALVVNEAAASGLALVTSDVVGAAPALVRSGVNGETFPRGDLAGLVGALRRVTDPGAIDRYRQASPGVLAEWRRDHDPVDGIREALVRCGVLPG